ncbi:ABC transporter substrate-binding protein [Paenibacillus sp. 481]|uniref:ABC transporter substrate-binding protein n=1 Tax=Paenibacillus sp. 481 TaxID=2835869 RepID=UPI001E46199D|nr:ABC transporter substrate-binding protein [Paenibacillus sp. 481]UHA72636.1 ABC transporter substrate-binding protein [Paenibacillus sp. 481]
MKHTKNWGVILSALLLMGSILLACSSQTGDEKKAVDSAHTPTNQPNTLSTSSQTATNTETTASALRKFTDYKGHTLEIPVTPQRIVFWGETFSDLLTLNVNVVGTAHMFTKGSMYEHQMSQIQDIGFPINLEKTLELKPDLIITASTDEKEYEQLSKIAPTIVFDTFEPLENRIKLLGDILGKKQEAEQWITAFNMKTKEMWKQLHEAGIKPGETASVLTYYPGDRLFVMARAGLPQMLYDPDGFKPTAKIQDVLDSNKGFEQISIELLHEFAGDRIFILTPHDDESKRSTEEMMKSAIWTNLPAVKQGHVYTVEIDKADSDALSRQWLLDELPKLLLKK